VDNLAASQLNLASPDLYYTLILHTALGKDHFVSVTGEYRTFIFISNLYFTVQMTDTEYTCFANRLSRLTRLSGPVRAMKSPHDGVSERQSVNAPREFMKLINWLMTHVTDPVRVALV